MVERGKNGFKPREFIGADGSISRKMKIIFSGNFKEVMKRAENRRRIEKEQGIPMSSVGHFNEHIGLQEGAGSNMVNNRRERRTRGKGKKINPK